MNSQVKRIYDILPVAFQNLVLTGFSIILDGKRYGGKFKQYSEFLERSEYFSDIELKDFQDINLCKIVNHAYDTVPYYRKKMKSIKLRPSDIKTQDDLYKFPILTRKEIIENFDELRSKSFTRKQLTLGHTSGTTGSPLEVLYDQNVIAMTYAVLDRQYKWAGAHLKKFGDPVAILRGNIIVPITQKTPPYWRHNYYHNHLLMSSFHLSSENLPAYINKLKKFSPRIIDGYPSTLYVLARYLLSVDTSLPVQAVLTSSETLYDFQREAIEEAFECKVFDYFGAAERVMFATECEQHKGHHLCSEYGITEIIGEDGGKMNDGKIGKIVGTSLHNYGMPLIRYMSSDLTAIKIKKCGCGRNLPLMDDVSTKAEDIIALNDGRLISPSVLTHPFKPLHSIDASQIIQEDYDNIHIKIVANSNYTEEDSAHLTNEFKKRMGDDVNIKIEKVTELERTKAGKFKWVISKVDKGIKMPN